jgi:hypothetical protein
MHGVCPEDAIPGPQFCIFNNGLNIHTSAVLIDISHSSCLT